jgi:thiamine-monophosphate kinase
LKLKQYGEFRLIELIKKRITGPKLPPYPLVVGPGDDSFVARAQPGKLIAATNDVLVENIHFSRKWASPRQIGYKAITVNLSDLAAMGWCEPRYALIGLALTKETDTRFVEELYKGMNLAASKYGLIIAGGDTVSSKHDMMISVSLIGELRRKFMLTRSGAKPGDAIVVTGTFGDSAAGLEILRRRLPRRGAGARYLLKKHFMPEPRLAQAKSIALSGAATSMIDSSDGLSASLKFISEMSGTGFAVDAERVPVSKQLKAFAGRDCLGFALHGGEEYELVFTVGKSRLKDILRNIPGLTHIGWVAKKGTAEYSIGGKPAVVRKTGYEHFR